MTFSYWILILVFALGLGELSVGSAFGAIYSIPHLPSANSPKFSLNNRGTPFISKGPIQSKSSLSTANFTPSGHDLCAPHITEVEYSHGIPPKLLRAISLVESGRTKGGQKVSWPWTVNVEGKGHYYNSKQEAINAVKAFQAQGINSIDVGCMQISLKHHKGAFNSVEEALDPAKNVAYAARYLSTLKSDAPSWFKAVGNYHSATPIHHNRYKNVVLKEWQKERGFKQELLESYNSLTSPQRPPLKLATFQRPQVYKAPTLTNKGLKMGPQPKIYTLKMPGSKKMTAVSSPYGNSGGLRIMRRM